MAAGLSTCLAIISVGAFHEFFPHTTRGQAAGLATFGSITMAAQVDAGAEAVRSTPPSVSGEAMPVGDLAGWRQVFTDDFSSDVAVGDFPAQVTSNWRAYPSPAKDTSGHGTYSPQQVVSVSGGVLTNFIHTDNGGPKVAAIIPKLAGTSANGVTYGRFAVRFRADSLPGYKIAWMLWPDSGNNAKDGEIDFPEMNLDSPTMFGFMHHTNATTTPDQAWVRANVDITAWHTAVMEWSPGLVVYILDGAEIGRVTDRVPTTPMHWILQTETALNPPATPAATVQGNVQIDWVAAWAYNPTPG